MGAGGAGRRLGGGETAFRRARTAPDRALEDPCALFQREDRLELSAVRRDAAVRGADLAATRPNAALAGGERPLPGSLRDYAADPPAPRALEGRPPRLGARKRRPGKLDPWV